jgi:hypothetical protein
VGGLLLSTIGAIERCRKSGDVSPQSILSGVFVRCTRSAVRNGSAVRYFFLGFRN